MTTEMAMLAFAIVLGIVQLLLAAQGSVMQRELKWNLGARDAKMPDLTGIPGRLERAFKNFMETFPLFAAAVLLITALKITTPVSALGAQFYFYGRLLYVGIYAVGTPGLRTLVWLVATVGIIMVLSALL